MPKTPTEDLLAATDRCVLCGQCLPHCPSYRLWHNEADSPRGRIALLQALARGQLEPTPGLLLHIDRCLGCRACERMCPSLVEYGQIIDQGRALLRPHQTPPVVLTRLLSSVTDVSGLQRKARLLRLYQRSGLQSLARRSGALKRLGLAEQEAALPELPAPAHLASSYPASGAQRGRVALFTGCIGTIMDGTVLEATISVLTRLGFAVEVPKQQGCCGALHQHNGEPARARELALQNIAAFAGVDAIVSSASGCAAQLHEYQHLYGESLPAPLYEISDFITRHWLAGLALRALPLHAAYHLPCSERNVLRQPNSSERLLAMVPALQLVALPGNEFCCGAAGSYLLSQPEAATTLREEKLAAIAELHPDVVLSSNTSCALHLRNGLQQQSIAIPVRHPVELLAEALAD